MNMELDFYLLPISNRVLKIMDNTLSNQVIPEEINSMVLDITSSKIPNGGVYNIDIKPYLRNYRKDMEIYTITSAILGFAETQPIPDGVYRIKLTINNVYTKEHKFICFVSVKEKVDALKLETGYKVEIGKNDMYYTGTNSKESIEKVQLAQALVDTLYECGRTQNEIEANNALDKLNRLMLI